MGELSSNLMATMSSGAEAVELCVNEAALLAKKKAKQAQYTAKYNAKKKAEKLAAKGYTVPTFKPPVAPPTVVAESQLPTLPAYKTKAKQQEYSARYRAKKAALKQAVQQEVRPLSNAWPIGDDVVRTQSTTYAQTVERKYTHWVNSLTEEQRAAIHRYTGIEYQEINHGLRYPHLPQPASYARYTETRTQIAKALDTAKAIAKPPPPELVWRGMSNQGAKQFAAKLDTGDIIKLDGFQSTSIDPHFASKWSMDEGIIYEIKPVSGAYVKALSGSPREYEYLLPHGQQYKVRGRVTIKMQIKDPYNLKPIVRERTVIQLEMLE